MLAGDALIVLAFETLARALAPQAAAAGAARRHRRRARSARRAASSPDRPGNPRPPCRSSTISAPRPARCSSARRSPAPPRPGVDPEPWRALGEAIGEAYQVADDLRDVLCDAEELGKPIGQDARRMRPNAAAQLGVGGAKARLGALVDAAAAAIPRLPRRRGVADADPRPDPGVLPQTARARRGLRCRRRRPAPSRPPLGERLRQLAQPARRQPGVPALGGGVPAHARRSPSGARARCSISAPASSIRRSSPPACGSTCSRGSPTGRARPVARRRDRPRARGDASGCCAPRRR